MILQESVNPFHPPEAIQIRVIVTVRGKDYGAMELISEMALKYGRYASAASAIRDRIDYAAKRLLDDNQVWPDTQGIYRKKKKTDLGRVLAALEAELQNDLEGTKKK